MHARQLGGSAVRELQQLVERPEPLVDRKAHFPVVQGGFLAIRSHRAHVVCAALVCGRQGLRGLVVALVGVLAMVSGVRWLHQLLHRHLADPVDRLFQRCISRGIVVVVWAYVKLSHKKDQSYILTGSLLVFRK